MIVEIKSGKVQGECYDGQVVLFAGIPYAAPPVGNLRWREPQPVRKWEGVLDCTHFSHCAYQMNVEDWNKEIESPYGKEYNIREEEIPDEDCLYLNIWTLAKNVKEKKKYPVLCIIYGGGFESGSGGVPVLDGANLAKQEIVVVTINYRLGVFGFLAHPKLSEESSSHTSGNYGLLDQIQALHWIQENIENFGGDSDQVTISGESAGSISVNALCESPFAVGLFARAAAESGTHIGKDTYCPQITLKDAEFKGNKYVQELGVGSVEELRKVPASGLFAKDGGFFPFRDGIVWPESTFIKRNLNDIPLLLGSNADEGSIFMHYFKLEDYSQRFLEIARERYGKDIEQFLQRFPVDDLETSANTICNAYGEKIFAYTIYLWAKMHAEWGRSDVYYYYFSRVTPRSDYGAFHSSELPYFYRNLDKSEKQWDDIDQILMETMSTYFVQFVKSGNPNGKLTEEWKAFSENQELVMEFGDHIGMIVHPSKEMFQIYDRHDNNTWF